MGAQEAARACMHSCEEQLAWQCLLRRAQVDDQVAADASQALPEVQHGLQQELRAHRTCPGVAPGGRTELARVEAVQR